MISFNTLEFTDDNQNLSIDISIEDTETYAGYYISKVYVEYYQNRNVTGAPSDFAAVAFENTDTSVTSYSGKLSVEAMRTANPKVQSYSGGLFYVTVVCVDSADEDSDVIGETGAVLDWQKVYQLGMQLVASMSKGFGKGSCDVPEHLEQFVLVWHALELALNAQDTDMIDRLWRRFIEFTPALSSDSSTCNCAQ